MEIKHRSNLNKLLPNRKLVGAEIGVAEGLNSNDMLSNWNIKTLYMVDNWSCIPNQKGDGASENSWHLRNYDNVKEIAKRHGKKAVILKGMSVDMSKQIPDGSLDFVYLDADHSYQGVLNDLIYWTPKVRKGGFLAGHDYENEAYGVKAAVADFTKDKYEVHTIPEHKPEDAGFYFIKI